MTYPGPRDVEIGRCYGQVRILRHELVQTPSQRRTMVWCVCACGTTFRTSPANLRHGITRSCGCYRDACSRLRMQRWNHARGKLMRAAAQHGRQARRHTCQ